MNRMVLLPIAVVVLVCTVINRVRALEQPNREVSPIYEVAIPPGYREWQLIAVDNLLLAGKTDQLRAQLGNSIAMKAFKDKTLPFPDGAIIAAIHWTRVTSRDNDKVLGGPFPGAESFIIGSLVNIEFMVKDSKKYAGTGAGALLALRTVKRGTGLCTRRALPATSLRKIATTFSPTMHPSL